LEAANRNLLEAVEEFKRRKELAAEDKERKRGIGVDAYNEEEYLR
jgi:hypothetical protein